LSQGKLAMPAKLTAKITRMETARAGNLLTCNPLLGFRRRDPNRDVDRQSSLAVNAGQTVE
jgi:hypothetical protein